jgi:hypothetical protein
VAGDGFQSGYRCNANSVFRWCEYRRVQANFQEQFARAKAKHDLGNRTGMNVLVVVPSPLSFRVGSCRCLRVEAVARGKHAGSAFANWTILSETRYIDEEGAALEVPRERPPGVAAAGSDPIKATHSRPTSLLR